MTPERTPQPQAAQSGIHLCSSLGSTHLTSEQFGELVARDATAASPELAAVEAHLLACETCAAELASLSEAIGFFREASSAYADNELRRIPRWEMPSRRVLSHSFVPAYWLAAAAMLLTALLPLQVMRRHAIQPQRAAVATRAAASVTDLSTQSEQSDEALMDDVDRHISASVPSPMQALADPTEDASTAGVATPGATSTQRKDQP